MDYPIGSWNGLNVCVNKFIQMLSPNTQRDFAEGGPVESNTWKKEKKNRCERKLMLREIKNLISQNYTLKKKSK